MADGALESPSSSLQSPSSVTDLEQKSATSLAIPVSTTTDKPSVAAEDSKTSSHDHERDHEHANEDDDALSAVTGNDPTIVLNDVHVRIQKRPNQLKESDELEYESVILPTMTLPEKPTLDSIREALLNCELGRPERDIFFPTWTKSIYISWQLPADSTISISTSNGIETTSESSESSRPDPATSTSTTDSTTDSTIFSEPATIDTDTELQKVIAREQSSPGSLCLRLQECRNARYSRKRDKRTPKSRTHSPPPVYNANMFYSQTPIAFPVFAEAGAGKSCSDGTVYFDGPLTFGYPLHPGYGCTPMHSGGMGYAPEFAYVPPFAVMPFMYAPHNAQH